MGLQALITRGDLVGKVEPYILRRLTRAVYKIQESDPALLLSLNRLDILARLNFLQMEDIDFPFAEEVYFETIRAQSDGTFKDPHDSTRTSFQAYVTSFRKLSQSLTTGFSNTGPFVPLARDGSILNGAHRVAVALFKGIRVITIQTELEPLNADWDYLQARGVSDGHLQHLLYLFSAHAPHVYMAIFWPIAEKLGIGPEMLKKEVNTVCLRGNLQMVKNIAFEAYKEMSWIGSPSNNFQGLEAKLGISAGRLFEEQPVSVSIFQEREGLDEVRRVKATLRSHDGGSTRAVHITDNGTETKYLAGLLFRGSGQHFLKLGNPFRFATRGDLSAVRRKALEEGIEPNSFAIDGSAILGLYGLREPRDFDFLTLDEEVANRLGGDIRTEQLLHHEEPARRLIRSPRFHFELDELRIISLEQVARMKGNRQEIKDLDDLKLLKPILEGEKKKFRPSQSARVRLFRLRFRKSIRGAVRKILRAVGLAQVAKRWYLRLFN